MPEEERAVVGLGNAVVDVLSHVDDAFLAAHGLPKGAMTLVDGARAGRLQAAMAPSLEASGGSAANTVAGIAARGGKAAFIGRTAGDRLGGVFARDMRALGVDFAAPPSAAGAGTGRCLVMVTPDAQRTMCTWLGAAAELAPGDVDPAQVAAARIAYLEGYLWDPPAAREACRKAASIARAAGRKVALSLSDPFCVERHRRDFRALVDGGGVDILVANEAELAALYEAADFESGLAAVRGACAAAALTRGPRGSVVAAGGEVHEIAAVPVSRVVDTTGAGDLYAAGFLHVLASGGSAAEAGRAGADAAAATLGHLGARPPAG